MLLLLLLLVLLPVLRADCLRLLPVVRRQRLRLIARAEGAKAEPREHAGRRWMRGYGVALL